MNLQELTAGWDGSYEASLSEDAPVGERRPYNKVYDSLVSTSPLRFRPFPNDPNPNFMERLRIWLAQFKDEERCAAFLLASNTLFITRVQFEGLQRRLFRELRQLMLESWLVAHHHADFDYVKALSHIDEEMNRTVFIPNSDSTPLNSFIHVNRNYFHRHGKRRLIAESVAFWTHASSAASAAHDPSVAHIATTFHEKCVKSHPALKEKTRIVVLEDFSGSGSDLCKAVKKLQSANLPVTEVIVAPIVATTQAIANIEETCRIASSHTHTRFTVLSALQIPNRLRCVPKAQERSYLDDVVFFPNLAAAVAELSNTFYHSHAKALFDETKRHGFGRCGLALVFSSNTPDNSLPVIWVDTTTWSALFPRASRYL